MFFDDILKLVLNIWYRYQVIQNFLSMLQLIFKHIYHFLSISLWGSDVLLFPELINIVSILFYNIIEFIILLYTFPVIFFARYKKYITCLISFSKFPDVLPTITCARTIGNLGSICLGLSIFRLECLDILRLETLVTRATYANILSVHFPWIVLHLASDIIIT